MKLNPVYRKDSKTGSRSLRLIISLVGYNLILIIIGFSLLFSRITTGDKPGSTDYSAMLELYILSSSVELMLMMLLAPALTATTISGERERQTLDMLLATRMRPMTILLGKLYSSMDLLILLIISNMPVLGLVFIYGGIRISDLFINQGVLVLLALTVGMAGIFFSTIYRKTLTANVAAYAYTIMMNGGIMGVVYVMCRVGKVFGEKGSDLFGNFIYLLLLNPAISFYSLINNQVGDSGATLRFLNMIGNGKYTANFVTDHWLGISLLLQVLLALLLLECAAINLEPIRQKKKIFSRKKR